MKYLLILLTVACSCCGTKGNKTTAAGNNTDGSNTTISTGTNGSQAGENASVNGSNAVALYFGSMASGPIGDDFLKTWLQNFIRDEKVSLRADKYSACGKEGEYIIVIYKNGLSADKENKFTTQLKTVIDTEIKRTKAENASSGSVEIRPDPKPEDYTYCRLGHKKWL